MYKRQVINRDDHYQATLLDKQDALQIYKDIKTKDIRIELNTVSNRYWKTDRDPDFPKEFYDSHIDVYKRQTLYWTFNCNASHYDFLKNHYLTNLKVKRCSHMDLEHSLQKHSLNCLKLC